MVELEGLGRANLASRLGAETEVAMVLKRVGVLSAGKIFGIVYAVFGLIAGVFLSLFSLLGLAFGAFQDESPDVFFGLLFGIGAVVFLPVFYGVMGFIGGLLAAGIYNLVARFAGGLELELE